MNLKNIASIVNGELIRKSTTKNSISCVSTDTREISPNCLFIALCGKKFDGHDYINVAIGKGANSICVSDVTKMTEGDYNAILVSDTLKAYQMIAKAKRIEEDFKVIGITGSVGKTSTREMVFAAISSSINTYQTKENFNNEIGLPKTLLEATAGTEVCITELGMRGKGEILELTMIAQPDIAVITNIGIAHIERLGSQDEIFHAKIEIAEGLKPGGLLILNGNDPYLSMYCERMTGKIRTTLVITDESVPANADLVIKAFNIILSESSVIFSVEIKAISGIPIIIDNVMIPVPGIHNVTNALTGIGAGIELGLNLNDIIKGLMSYKNVGNRQKVLHYNGMTIIDDSYNAGLESMKAAISMLSNIAGTKRKIAALGGMLELGKFSEFAHEKVGEECVLQGIDIVFTCGEQTIPIETGIIKENEHLQSQPISNPKSIIYKHFETRDELISELVNEIGNDDVILIKGSRGFGMEKVTEAIMQEKV